MEFLTENRMIVNQGWRTLSIFFTSNISVTGVCLKIMDL